MDENVRWATVVERLLLLARCNSRCNISVALGELEDRRKALDSIKLS